MAEMVRWCGAHGSDWYRAWCEAIEMAMREGHRVDDFVPCRPVEGVWSLPGELIDPATVDYEAAANVLRKHVSRPLIGFDALAEKVVNAALGG